MSQREYKSLRKDLKILLCPDVLGWAIYNRCKLLQEQLPFDITLMAGCRNVEAVRREIDKHDIVHLNFTWGITDYYDIVLKQPKKFILSIVNERSLINGDGIIIHQFEEMIGAANETITNSKLMAEKCGATYIPNGVSFDVFPNYKKPVVGYAGTSKDNKNWKAVKQACDELGIEFRTAFYDGKREDGEIPHSLMNDFYMGLDIYVHASLTEGFNNTIVEALSCNIPVLMTRVGMWKEFEGWVTFIEPTSESIKNELKKFVGRRIIANKFDWKNVLPQYKALYERVHDRQRTADK